MLCYSRCLTFGLFEATPEAYRNLKFTTSQFLRITSAANNKLSMRMRVFLINFFSWHRVIQYRFLNAFHCYGRDIQFKRTDLTLNQTICCIDLHGCKSWLHTNLMHPFHLSFMEAICVNLRCNIEINNI
uniref:Uncharacterized protein n=1 Tax=Glossina pallidipes TaxID=7398 RepID=A0A1A9ZJK8_GLOPL